MKIFLTGATGFVGSRVLDKLLEKESYHVTALVRQEADATKLASRGVKPLLGNLTSLDVAASAAREADAILHLAFIHDFSKYKESIETDKRFIETIINAISGSNKTFIITAGTTNCGDTGSKLALEAGPGSQGRGLNEAVALKGNEEGVKASVFRLPLYVYDDSAFCSFMANIRVQAARKHNVSHYIESGSSKFSAVHVEDAAEAFVAGASIGPPGGIYHIVGEQGITNKQLAEGVAKKLSKPGHEVPVRSASREEAGSIYDLPMFGILFGSNNDADNSKAKKELKWQPKHTTGFVDVIARSG